MLDAQSRDMVFAGHTNQVELAPHYSNAIPRISMSEHVHPTRHAALLCVLEAKR
jgi:hypothetical protein